MKLIMIFLHIEMTISFGDRMGEMARRICFIPMIDTHLIYDELLVDFKYFNGFSLRQKQKSIESMHSSILNINPSLNILEISTKSPNPTGISLSAFNLKFMDEISGIEYPLENVFQASKIFEKGGPYRDLLNVHPKDAKRDERLKCSGRLIGFEYNNSSWEIEPKTMFYDWIYIKSLYRNKILAKKIMSYDAFTDIEFNQEKSINCQARAAAIFVSLVKLGKIDEALQCKSNFKEIYSSNHSKSTQISIFDM